MATVDLTQLGEGFTGGLTQALGYIVYGIFIILLLAFFLGIFHYFSFNIKIREIPLHGSGTDNVLAPGKERLNKAKWVKNKTEWRLLFPLFGTKSIEPFDAEYIYPGNNVFAFVFNNEYIPGRINIDQSEKTIRSSINPVPHSVRNWQSLTHKKLAQEFAKEDWWSENKTMMVALLCGVACLAACVLTIYLSYKYATGIEQGLANLGELMKGIGVIPEKFR